MTKPTLLAASAVLLISLSAFAGKGEREYMKKEVNPSIAEAQTKFKASCGCPLVITIANSTMQTENDLYVAKHVVDSISREAPAYCIDAASKKAMCQLRTLEIGKAEKTAFTFAGGKGVSLHDGQSFYGWDIISRELDK